MSESDRGSAGNEIAIVGLALRFPGASDVDQLWRNLAGGVESVRFLDDETLRAAGLPDAVLLDPRYVHAASVLDGVDLFDAAFFGLTPAEARITDPQHRLLLECAYESLENAGYASRRGRGRVGVFAGVGMNSYYLNHVLPHADLLRTAGFYALAIGNDACYAVTRISYKLDLTGPSVNVYTACSTSLVAVDLACKSLLMHESDLALAGAATVFTPARGYVHEEGGIFSPDGHCRAFDAAARGTVFGSGAAMVVLKRLDEALADGDHVHAVIRGSAINNDGALKVGFTAPSVQGQTDVIVAAHALAGVDPDTVSYVEAHGTGTELGDPIEVTALTKAFRKRTDRTRFCALGSIKANFGHLDTAAGIAGLVKAVLALQHREIPPSINFERPNPKIELASSPFFVNQALRPWSDASGPRRAGVSSFGIGGANAHVILEEAPVRPASGVSRGWHLLTLSAKTPGALDRAARNLAARLRADPDLNVADVAFSLQVGREEHGHRRALVCTDLEDAVRVLDGADPARASSGAPGEVDPGVVFVFPDVGAEHAGMGSALRSEPVFREELGRCCAILSDSIGRDVERELLADAAADRARPLETAIAPAALLAIEYALARLWMSWGVTPAAVVGCGIGDVAAACVAGLVSLDDALAVAASRAPEVPAPRVATRRPILPYLSTVTGEWFGPSGAAAAARATRIGGPPVRVAAAREILGELPGRLLLEVGPGGTAAPHPLGRPVIASLPSGADERADHAVLLGALGALWASGCSVSWPALSKHERRSRVPLPTYPFDRQSHWLEPGSVAGAAPEPAAPTANRPEIHEDVRDWGYVPTWRRTLLPVDAGARRGVWVLLGDEGPLAAELAARLEARGAQVVPVFAGEGYRALGRGYTVRPASPSDHKALLADLLARDRDPERIVHLWSALPLGDHRIATPERALDRSFFSLLHVAQAIANLRGGRPLRIDIVSTHAQKACWSDAVQAERAALIGPCRVIPQEMPLVACRAVDVALAGGDVGDVRSCVALLERELGADGSEPFVAIRGGDRLALEYAPAPLAPAGGAWAGLRENGVYLVTGGLGGIGLAIARHLARTARARLVLTSRSGLPPRETWAEWLATMSPEDRISLRIRAVQEVEAAGAQVRVVHADVCDRERMAHAVREARSAFGALHGVIHAAGVPGGGMIALRTHEAAASVLRPKVEGVRVVHELVRDPEIDFLALCSSITAVTGGVGQVDYCAANAVLDAFAGEEQGRGPRVVSIGWERWGEVGMAVDAEAALAAARAGTRAETEEVRSRTLGANDPWFERSFTGSSGDEVFELTLDASAHWVLSEHRIHGIPALPGTVYLDLVWAALSALMPSPGIAFDEVVFLTPLRVRNGGKKRVRLVLARRDGAAFAFEVSSCEGESRSGDLLWESHVAGKVRALPEAPARRYDGAAVLRRCPETNLAARASSGGPAAPELVEVGPRWRSFVNVHTGSDEAVALLELSHEFSGDLERHRLHPALLDCATFFGMLREEDALLPLSYRGLRAYRRLPRRFYSHLQRDARSARGEETASYRVTLFDEGGYVLAEIGEFTAKRLRQARPPDPPRSSVAQPLGHASLQGIRTAQALEVLQRVLATGAAPHVVVSPMDLSQRVALGSSWPSPVAGPEGRAADLHPRPDLATPYVSPRDEIEGRLARVWEELLGTSAIGVDDDYFELGADSLLITRAVIRVREVFGIDLPVEDIFEHPTIARLAALIRRASERDIARAAGTDWESGEL